MHFRLISLCFIVFVSSNTYAQSWVVKFVDEVNATKYLDNAKDNINTFKRLSQSSPIYHLKFDEFISESELMSNHRIESITPQVDVKSRIDPNDPLYMEQWSLPIIQADMAWNEVNHGVTSNGQKIVIAILDDNIDIYHEDLINNIWTNDGEIPNDGLDNDQNGNIDDYYGLHVDFGNDDHPIGPHGTKVAGVIGAEGNNEIGIAGINWDIEMMIISGANNSADIIEGYNYVLDQRKLYNESNGQKGAFVIATNFSAGISRAFGDEYPIWCETYDELGEAGVLSVCATDNEEYNVDVEGDMPATCNSNYLIAVTSTDMFDKKASTAAYGSVNIDLGAPGSNTFSTTYDNKYSDFNGTSAACPHVAGALGLLYAVNCDSLLSQSNINPAATALLIKDAVLQNVDGLPGLTSVTASGGRLNIFEAMKGLSRICSSASPSQREELDIINLGPNPVSDIIILEYGFKSFTEHRIAVYNMIGQLMQTQVVVPSLFENTPVQLDVSRLGKGMYVLTIDDRDKLISTKFMRAN